MSTWSAAIGLLLAGVVSAAAAEPSSSPAVDTPEGHVWRLIRLRGQPDEALAGLPGGVTIRFEAGRLQGFSGCNQLVGSYTLERDRLIVGPLAGTMMACPQPAMAIETEFKEALAGALTFRLVAGRLTLAAESDADPRLVFEAVPPPRLEGITWEVTGFNNGRHAVVSPQIGTTLTVSFQDGSVVGHAGCNNFRASYTREGDRLTIGPTAATRKACNDEGVMQQEREFLAALESTTTWAIDRDMLDLHRADGERVLFAGASAK